MGSWSYRARELWQLHKREIKRYGICAWIVIIGVVREKYFLAWLGLGAAVAMYCYDRWGKPWEERGRILMGGKKTDNYAS
jgi:hypothetical protein